MDKRAVANHTNILVLIGPSGAGKSTVARELIKQGIVSINPSWTTRPVREGEDEMEHVFVDDKEFGRRASEGFFLDWAQPFDLPYSYGLPPIDLSSKAVPLVMLRSFLIPMLLKYYKNLVIYQIETPYEIASSRVKERKAAAGTRLKQFNEEVAQGRLFAQRVFVSNTGNSKQLAKEIKQAIKQDFANLHTL